ncbi:MAG: PHP domain-containing protein, partial [Phycisphaerae bacterium]|nr:PHP domain-containing protein [Phycisphaerae bacterium]
MKIRSDWHIHTRNSCDDACLSIEEILAGAKANGLTRLGITDHVHVRLNFPDIEASRREFDGAQTNLSLHFGVEVSCVAQWELDEIASDPVKYKNNLYGVREGGPPNAELAVALTREDIDHFGIEYVVGGAHWPKHFLDPTPENMIRDYHRQNLFLACHPDVDIVAHPWWWMGLWRDEDGVYRTDPWLADFNVIPVSMHDEFAAAAIQHGKAVEINLAGMVMSNCFTDKFKQQYCEYLAGLQARGVAMSIGSDT